MNSTHKTDSERFDTIINIVVDMLPDDIKVVSVSGGVPGLIQYASYSLPNDDPSIVRMGERWVDLKIVYLRGAKIEITLHEDLDTVGGLKYIDLIDVSNPDNQVETIEILAKIIIENTRN